MTVWMGRMGRMVLGYLERTEGCEIIGATERNDHPELGNDVGRVVFGRPIGVSLEGTLSNCILGANVLIDFTLPEASIHHAKICAEKGVAIVCGTTGMNPKQQENFLEFWIIQISKIL